MEWITLASALTASDSVDYDIHAIHPAAVGNRLLRRRSLLSSGGSTAHDFVMTISHDSEAVRLYRARRRGAD